MLAVPGKLDKVCRASVIGHVSFYHTEPQKLLGVRTLCAIALLSPSSSFHFKYIPYEARVKMK